MIHNSKIPMEVFEINPDVVSWVVGVVCGTVDVVVVDVDVTTSSSGS